MCSMRNVEGVYTRAVPVNARVAQLPFRTMFIQVRDTPNENSLMFLPGRQILPSGTAQFNSIVEAKSSPLARCVLL